MNAKQLPLSNLNNVPVEGMPEFMIISGNSMDCAKGAAITAKATGSIGATEIHSKLVSFHSADTVIEFFAIVERKDHGNR